MGFFDLHCVESGLALTGSTGLLLIANEKDRWLPCAVPTFDTYDRLGGIDNVYLDDVGDEILSSVNVPSLPRGGDGLALEDLVAELCAQAGTWAGRETSYTLVDAAIYRAVVETMREREGFDDVALDALPWPALVAKAIPFAEARRRYERMEPTNLAEMRDLVRFVAWGTVLRPASELPSGQYGGLTPPKQSVAASYALDVVERARARYAAYPQLLEAVEENADRWSELDGEEHRERRARQRGKPVIVRVEKLFMARLMTGDHVLEIGAREVPMVVRLLRERLVGHGESVHLQSSNFAVTFAPGEAASWKKDHEQGRFVIEATADAAAELIGALVEPKPRNAALEAYPGLRVRPD